MKPALPFSSHKFTMGMIWRITACLLLPLALASAAAAQRDKTEDPTAVLSFLIIKEDNGKPVRNAAVIMHPVNSGG